MSYLPLIATLTALLCGPLLYAVARHRAGVLAFLDGFVLVSIAGLVLLEVVPGAFGEGGAWSLAFLVLGAIGPNLLERALHHARREAHIATLGLAVLGLLLHSVADGAALSPNADHDAHEALALAVVVHSVPVGLVVWWIMAPVFGPLWPALTIAAMCCGTVAGFVFGIELNEVLGAQAFAWFEALVAGSILHVVFGRPHLDEHEHESHAAPPFEGLGNLVALIALALLESLAPHHGLLGGFVGRFRDLTLEGAPALLFAYLAGSLIGSGISEARLRWVSQGAGVFEHSLRGTLLGLFLPLRSGAGLSTYCRLLQAGVRHSAAIAHLHAASALGLTATLLSIPLLSVELSLARILVVAALSVLVSTLLAGPGSERLAPPVAVVPLHPGARLLERPRGLARLGRGLMEQVDGTVSWVLAGFALAALAMPYLDSLAFASWPQGLDLIVFALLGLPLYLCATGATPLVAVLLAWGLSPGAGMAVLIVGSAANLATLRALRQLHGTRFAVLFGTLVGLGAVTAGGLINGFGRAGLGPGLISVGPLADPSASALEIGCALILAGLFVTSLLRRGGRRWISGLVLDPRAAEGSR